MKLLVLKLLHGSAGQLLDRGTQLRNPNIFDGEINLLFFRDQFLLYAISNGLVRVYYGIDIHRFLPSQLCSFDGLMDGYDVCCFHPYSLPNALVCLVALVPAEGELDCTLSSGIYITATTNGTNYLRPLLIHKCKNYLHQMSLH